MEEEGCLVLEGPWPEEEPAPEFLLMISPGMKSSYRIFGDCVRFDVTYNLCRLRTSSDRKWNVGMFACFSENMTPFPVGVLLINAETTLSFRSIFRYFFNEMGVPETVITDQQGSA